MCDEMLSGLIESMSHTIDTSILTFRYTVLGSYSNDEY